MQTYKHKQNGSFILFALSLGVLMTVWILFKVFPGPGTIITAIIMVVLLICIVLFWSLTVELTIDHLSVKLGLGIIHKEIRYEDIREARVVKNPLYYGWGIRWIPRGYMYNVSGFGAVELEFNDDQRFRIGSDEPQKLLSAIRSRLKQSKEI